MSLKGKRALVTGASRGIGAAIAKALAAEGADVAITYEKSAEAAGEVVNAIKAIGRRAVAIQADSADAAAVQASVEKTVAELGGLDILVNNAGILRLSPVKDISLEDVNALLNVNVRAPIVASKAAIPHLGNATSELLEPGRLVGTCLSVGGSRSGAANTPPIVITDRSCSLVSQ